MLRSNLVARVVSSFSSIQVKRTTKILIILTAVFMVMASGEPVLAEICTKC